MSLNKQEMYWLHKFKDFQAKTVGLLIEIRDSLESINKSLQVPEEVVPTVIDIPFNESKGTCPSCDSVNVDVNDKVAPICYICKECKFVWRN